MIHIKGQITAVLAQVNNHYLALVVRFRKDEFFLAASFSSCNIRVRGFRAFLYTQIGVPVNDKSSDEEGEADLFSVKNNPY